MDKRIASPLEEDNVRRAVEWNRRHGQQYAGLYYDEGLAGPEGMDVQLFVTEDTTDDEIREAERAARQTQDVVGIMALVVPKEWLMPSDTRTTVSADIHTLRQIVETLTAGTLRWDDGETQLVDVTTASLLLQVDEALHEPTKSKVREKIGKSRAHFLHVVDLAWECVK